MKRWQIFVLWVFWVLILWLMAPCLDLTPESVFQEEQTYLVPWSCTCPWFKSRKYGCLSETLNCSSCHHTAGGCHWFDARCEKTKGYPMRTKESMASDSVLWWLGMNSGSELGKVWTTLFKVIPRLSESHFDFSCGACAVLGSPQILPGSGLGSNMDLHPMAFRNASDQGSWRQLLLLLQLPKLARTSDALSDKISEDAPVP
uniref:beta-D-galactosyl-(1->3)-N-acetyl-beta-D-galactosaminide alpha-2,3-sialyltransferase n=1 Tax=Prolemur simus TaxID=1328070 RepID=A0A8C8YJN2_PROSS